QLIRADYGSGKVIDYAYDAAGNRTKTESCLANTTLPAGAQPTLASAYDSVGAGSTIKARDVMFTENIQFSKAITLKGGYACDFLTVSGVTTIKGVLVISTGPAVLDRIAIQ
ncbi:MAG: hypothetical protein WA610_14620, partial [Thermodesulfovibrionales bacterium]